ncbi:carboxymuconolactone decarboxylase family protein [Pseudomaricurvus alkylphenolicus]|jgi:alkylhydroperoxidase family enzyme|uniref:carboxymuconolactone decarboxylase family protein n=1 Tax=Pseudomaricurvus alkylphenolicus TaxID=1306991 RepID=UPI0014235F7D|nr:carboxymuconolactone decarboxylase family protein [Pseudomaricurvus alkylphenolicus]NIB41468.1 carboxymuconolactone decarboxylase family protein [Pseudomaricurvus alkylphenolicus]
MTEMRVPPLTPEELTDKQQAFLKPVTDKNGAYPNIFGTLVRNFELFESWSVFGKYTMMDSSLDPQHRELLILRTAVNVDCEYEWHHHHHIGLRVGLDQDTIQKVKNNETLDEDEHNLLMQLVDDLSNNFTAGDQAWAAMTEKFGLNYTLDAIFTVGSYMALSMGLKSCGVQVERT